MVNTPLAFKAIWGKLPALQLSRLFISSRYPWAVLAGLMLAASFPKIGLAGLAWVAPGMILMAAFGNRGGAAFRIGYVAALAHYLASLYWLLLIPVAWAPVLGWLALGAFLALFPATWVWFCWKIFPPQLVAVGVGSSNWGEQFLSAPWARRMVWNLSGAAAWVTWEMTLCRVLGGFPWNLLGDSQFHLVPLIQVASFTGVYGVSFLLVWTSLSLIGAMMVIIRRPVWRSAWAGEMILPMMVVCALYVTGYQKLLRPEPAGRELTVALVQPSIPQNLIWDPKESYHRFQQLLQLSVKALAGKPDLLIWPEAAVPGLVRVQDEISGPIADLARTNKVWMIIGGDDLQPHPRAKTLADADFFNSSFLVSPEGKLVGEYKKRNLVIFGEYVPLMRWLPFLKYLTPIEGGYTPGNGVTPFHLPNLKVNVSVLICFEDVFPHLVREYVFGDTDFLVNLTNNGWFGEGAAQWQHAAAALFRAVENGLPLLRCANNGVTCWIDSGGRLRQVFESDTHGIYGPGFMIARIPLPTPGEGRPPTFYRLHGDWFGWGCVGWTLLRLLQTRLAREKSTKPVAA